MFAMFVLNPDITEQETKNDKHLQHTLSAYKTTLVIGNTLIQPQFIFNVCKCITFIL